MVVYIVIIKIFVIYPIFGEKKVIQNTDGRGLIIIGLIYNHLKRLVQKGQSLYL